MTTIEVEAKTLDEAISQAAERLEKSKEQLTIEVLSDSSGKMFGIIGSSKVRIRATTLEPKGVTDIKLAQEVLENILKLFGAEATIEAQEADDCITLTIKGDGSGILIGRKGQTLDAFQHLVNKMVQRSLSTKKQIVVDTEGYRHRRREALLDLVKHLSEKAKAKGVPVSTNPLNPFERRIIHLALQDDAELTTKSDGEGEFRRVVISPQKR